MTLLTDIRRDREAGTPGLWFTDGIVLRDVYAEDEGYELWYVAQAIECCGHPDDQSEANARRIARVPQLEEIALAAERVMHCATVANQQGLISKGVSVDLAEALAHLRTLLEGETT